MMDEPNLPNSPNYPKRSRFALGGLAVGLLLGLGLAAFLEYRNTAIQTEDDVFAFTKLPTLAVIQHNTLASDAVEVKVPAWKFWVNPNAPLPEKRA